MNFANFCSNDDVLREITLWLTNGDVYSLSLTCKLIYEMTSNVMSNKLAICNINLGHLLRNIEGLKKRKITNISVIGEFNKEERVQLQQLWKFLKPVKFTLDSNCADFQTFYKHKSLFKNMTYLEARNGSFDFINIDQFTNLDTIEINNSDDHDSHLRIKDMPNIKMLIVRDCLFTPHSELSDYIFGGRNAPNPEVVAQSRAMPHLTHLISHNALVKQQSLSLNAALTANSPLWIPNIVVMDVKSDDEKVRIFAHLDKFKYLRQFSYEAKAVSGFHTFPIVTTIEVLRLKGSFVKLEDNFERLSIPNITVICNDLEYPSKLLPECEYLQIDYSNKGIRKTGNQWYLKDRKWIMVAKFDVYDYFISKECE